MIFNSIEFLPFIVFFFVFFFILPWKQNKIFICILSYFFYSSFNPSYLILLFFSTLVDFFCAKKIFFSEKKTRWLVLSLTANLGVLFFFKYGGFFLENLINVLSVVNFSKQISIPDFILPVGISFYTFQTLSYSIDVYRGKIKPTNFLDFVLFVSYFPQLVAGPIIRAKDFLPQLAKRTFLTVKRLNLAIFLIISGLFKKIVIADSIAPFVNDIFQKPEIFSTTDHVLGVLGFTIQIYCDFSGYSDIAIGLALLMGFRIKKNFNYPYLASSLREFWQRWHISLSSWIRDYVYIPLGGNRRGNIRQSINLIAVMSLFGLWHGASWMFILWGTIHGVLLVIENQFRKLVKFFNFNLKFGFFLNLLKIILIFYIVSLNWIFFRADSFQKSLVFLESYVSFFEWNYNLVTNKTLLVFISLFISFGFILHFKRSFFKTKIHSLFYSLATAVMLFFILTCWNSNNAFIYFQF